LGGLVHDGGPARVATRGIDRRCLSSDVSVYFRAEARQKKSLSLERTQIRLRREGGEAPTKGCFALKLGTGSLNN
jgi:hypothetical protein